MLFPRFRPFRIEAVREQMILEHSRWLTAATRGRFDSPRIPVREVARGGFSELMSTTSGRRIASQWWEDALESDR